MGESRTIRTVAMLCSILLASSFPAAAAGAGGLRASRQLGFEVSEYRDADGGRWIHMTCEYEGIYGASIDELIATLWDFPRSPRVFSRIEAVRVRSESKDFAITEQRTAVRLLGLAYVSNLVFANRIERTGPREAKVSFETIETDDTCLSSKGGWTFSEDQGKDGPTTLARYSVDSYIKPRFPGQAAIMRGFGASDVARLLRELGAAVAEGTSRN